MKWFKHTANRWRRLIPLSQNGRVFLGYGYFELCYAFSSCTEQKKKHGDLQPHDIPKPWPWQWHSIQEHADHYMVTHLVSKLNFTYKVWHKKNPDRYHAFNHCTLHNNVINSLKCLMQKKGYLLPQAPSLKVETSHSKTNYVSKWGSVATSNLSGKSLWDVCNIAYAVYMQLR